MSQIAPSGPRPSPRADATGVCVVLVTTPSMEKAEAIAKALLAEHLIACANLLPGVRSLYEWKGALCDDGEVLMVLKSRSATFERLAERIRALHPYEVPEILELEVARGSSSYLAWVLGQVPADDRASPA